MKKTFFTLFVLFFIIGCSKKKNNERILVESNFCLSTEDKKNILQGILSNENVNDFLHLEIPERLPIKIISNKNFNDKLEINIKGKKIIFTSKDKTYEDILDINLEEINCQKFRIKFNFFSKIEGVSISGIISKNSQNKWLISNINVVEQ